MSVWDSGWRCPQMKVPPNQTLQRTARSRRCSSAHALGSPSLSLGRSAAKRISGVMPRIRFAALTVVWLTALGGPSRAGAQDDARVRDVVYGRKFGMALTMDVWKPAKRNGTAVLFVVSGAFKSDINMVGPDFFEPELFRPFLDRGQTLFLVC